MGDQKSAVRAGVASCLTAILGSDQQVRKVSEEELKALEVMEEYGIILSEMIASQETPVQYRQLASIILKHYVECHWSKLNDKFQEPELQEQTKVAIKELLPLCLGDCQSKVRACVAYAISAIAHWDWPENWSDLFSQLVMYLESGEPNVVHGTMRVLTEFCQDVSDSQVEHVANTIFPHLPRVILQVDLYTVHTRTRAVHIYNLLSGIVFSISSSFPNAAKLLLLPSLHIYVQAFVDILNSSLPSNTDYGLRKEVIMTLCHLLRSFPRPLTPHVMGVVTPIWNLLVSGTSVYLTSVVNSDDAVDGVCDSDGEVIGQESLIFAVFEFINVIGESDLLHPLLLPILPQLVHVLLLHMQITQEQSVSWMADVNRFVDEDENELSYSIRLSAMDLVLSLTEGPELTRPCYSAILSAINSHLEQTPALSSSHWWKIHEVSMLVGSILVEGLKRAQVEFDVEVFVNTFVFPAITQDSSALLSGRALWLAGKMSTFLSPSLLLQLLQIVASALLPCQKPVLRILAAKALYYFCSELKSSEHAQLLKKWLPDYLTCLCDLASTSHEDVVFLVIDSMQMVVRMDLPQTAQCAYKIVPMATSLFLQYSHDPGISSCIQELFEALAINPGCHASLYSHILPLVTDILSSTSPHLFLGLLAGVLDMLVPVVRGSVVERVTGLPQEFLDQVFPLIVRKILDSSDSAILQNGGECVRAFVSVAVQQLSNWRDVSGCGGLQYVVQVILHLLDPLMSEFSASFVGKLIIVFIKRMDGAVGQDLQLLLKAVLSKMHSVSSASVLQSLLLVFAHLVQTEMAEVLLFLSGIPDSSGKPALNYVLLEWCAAHPFFFGSYETKLSTLALCKLLTHMISMGDQRLADIMVPDHYTADRQGGIQTRSQRAAAQPVKLMEVRLPIKIVKLLVADLQHQLEDEELDDSEDQEGQDGSDEGDEMEACLERLLDEVGGCTGGVRGEQWEVKVDDDLIDEPAVLLNLQVHLSQYLLELTTQPVFSSFTGYLTQPELATLSKLSNSSQHSPTGH